MKNIGKYFIIFTIGFLVYPMIEIATRGYTHWSMMFTGGATFLCFYIIYICLENKSTFIKAFYGMICVVLLEFSIGLIVNKLFNMNVWDYSGMSFNLLGQISLGFSACWYLVAFMSFCLFNIIDFILSELLFSTQEHRGLAQDH